jgi:hypothetical protein
MSFQLTLGTQSTSIGAESHEEHDGALGFAGRLTGGEFSPSLFESSMFGVGN